MYTTHSKIEFYIFYVNNIFCEMKGKKVIQWGGGLEGMGEPSSFHLGSVIFYSFNFLCYNSSPEKERFSTQKIFLSEFWTYKDGTRFNLKRNEVSIQKDP